eukprot:TRINITY_DN3927_c0_g1_i3.p1 TRINITY_DN3927_c0_g1~~TRINITY_DN3927_c0_g1_i3.p1  ORF type:complete len:254 (+),score=50.73 TRINITY_DN3927_c0_g1_i3:95-763(+)
MDVLGTCDGAYGRDSGKAGNPGAGNQRGGPSGTTTNAAWDEDVSVSCAALEDGVKSVVASANRGGARISDEVLLNHELLQYSRQGNVRGVSDALDKGAWTETRRPLVMKPQKPDTDGKKGGGKGGKGDSKDDDPANVGMTPIMFSAQKGSAECVRRLIVAKVEEDGWSALHFASKEGHLEVCRILLDSNANPKLVNIDDQTPLDLADEDGNFKANFKELLAR